VFDKAIASILVGLLISAIVFVPVVFFQYRKYGQFSPSRMFWLIFAIVYFSGVIAYTIFPLPDLTPQWCAANPRPFNWDPIIYFKDMYHHLAGKSLLVWLRSWDVMQMVLNIVLFMPLGLITRQLYGFRVWQTGLLGLALSFGIETTQWSGNWGLAECAYRFADVNDLITNTSGAFLGAALALALPRFTDSPEFLEKRRGQARPLSRTRRFAGMFFDVLYMGILVIGMMAATVMAVALAQSFGVNAADVRIINTGMYVLSCIVIALLVLLPALLGSGASLGQRTVYLKPVAKNDSRIRLVLRALVVQGLSVLVLLLPNSESEPARLILGFVATVGFFAVPVSLVWVLFDPIGLSCRITGCQMVDSRADFSENTSGI
jgi:glycopeptide antibiotics resistance protein